MKKNKKACHFALKYKNYSTPTIKIPLELVTLEDNSYHLIVKVEIDQVQGDMIIDTGASVTVVDQKLFPASGEKATEINMQSGSVSGQINNVQLIKIRELKIGGRKIKNIHLASLDLDYVNEMYYKHLQRKIIGLLGCDFCVKYGAMIDYPHKELSIHKG